MMRGILLVSTCASGLIATTVATSVAAQESKTTSPGQDMQDTNGWT